MPPYKTLHADDEIADELHLPKYPHGPSLDDVVHKAASRQGILETACGGLITLDRIVYHVKEPATFAIWKLDK